MSKGLPKFKKLSTGGNVALPVTTTFFGFLPSATHSPPRELSKFSPTFITREEMAKHDVWSSCRRSMKAALALAVVSKLHQMSLLLLQLLSLLLLQLLSLLLLQLLSLPFFQLLSLLLLHLLSLLFLLFWLLLLRDCSC